MDETTNKGDLKNQEKTLKTKGLVDDEKEGTHTKTVKSEMIRAENADSIYE
ncbi:hypothetical protein [Brevibacillus daliensis]|uniref:hypothetical protein n=1 Tax=Brevibacillus daliensis TaxID=2892995 RepID=UPI001E472565|nr:hypothetical protein [Brevibacillus daliensis]